jgi:threonine aldolase
LSPQLPTQSAPQSLPIQFKSDNNAGICPEAWTALAAANAGHAPGYGADDWTQLAADTLREVFETDCEVFLVFNGTAANALALAAICRSSDAVICHEVAHINVDECGAPEFMSGGAKLLTCAGPHAKLTPAHVARFAVATLDEHSSRPRALSLTQSTEHGTVYTPAEVTALCALAHESHMKVHMDGARFANAVAALQCTPAEASWRAGVDVLCVGGTKNGLPFGEAILFFDRKLATEFRRRRKQGGQLASKMRFLAAPWCGVLRDGAWLRHAAHANRMASRLAAAIGTLPGTRLLAPVQANGVFIDLPAPVIDALRSRGWQFYTFIGATGLRFMCSWDTTPEVVDHLAADIVALTTEHNATHAQ